MKRKDLSHYLVLTIPHSSLGRKTPCFVPMSYMRQKGHCGQKSKGVRVRKVQSFLALAFEMRQEVAAKDVVQKSTDSETEKV